MHYRRANSILFEHHFSIFYLIRKVFSGNNIILVSSLWPSHLVSLIFLIFPNVTVVPFYHNSYFAHIKDKFFSRLIMLFSSVCFVDSQGTLDLVTSCRKDIRVHTIPYEFPFPKSIVPKPFSSRNFDIIFIGRLAPQKRFDLVFPLLKSLSNTSLENINIAFVFAHTSSKNLSEFQVRLQSINSISVSFFQNIPNEHVLDLLCSSKLFLQLSDYEGYSMTLSSTCWLYLFVRNLINYNQNFFIIHIHILFISMINQSLPLSQLSSF